MENCTVAGNNGPGIWFDTCTSGNLITIRNNYVANNNDCGIFIEVSTNALIYNNLVASNFAGIYNSDSSGVKVYNNTVAYTKDVPSYPWGPAIGMVVSSKQPNNMVNNEWKNNIVWKSACLFDMIISSNGMSFTNINGVLISVSNNICDNNCCYSTSTNRNQNYGGWPGQVGLSYDGLKDNMITNLSDWTKITGFDSNSSSCDPRFVNAPGGDYRLQSGSPLIDRGQSLPEVLFDYDGIPRPQGAGYDIGAFEGAYLAPNTVTQPQDQTVNLGDTATFCVTAMGITPVSYQWYFNQTNLLAGETSNCLTLTDVEPCQAGIYTVVISNLVGSVTSSNAVLTVKRVAPTITGQPANVTVCAGLR